MDKNNFFCYKTKNSDTTLTPSNINKESPLYFLGDTNEEAEEMYTSFEGILNGIAYTYSVSTGIDKYDLFGEGIIYLGEAVKSYDPTKNASFKTYAINRIKDGLNRYISVGVAMVSVPTYIKTAHNNIKKIGNELEKLEIDKRKIRLFLDTGDTKHIEINNKCEEIINKLENTAKRACVTLKTLINRAESIPIDIEFNEQSIGHATLFDNENQNNAVLLVDKIKTLMTPEELIISKGIMEDKTYEEIGKMLGGQTSSSVCQKIRKMRIRFKKKSILNQL